MMVDLKFAVLHRLSLHAKPPEVRLVERLSGSMYLWVELGIGVARPFFRCDHTCQTAITPITPVRL